METAPTTSTWPAEARGVADLVAVLTAGDEIDEAGGATAARAMPFTQLAHGLQCARQLRAARPDDIELQVAGLLHDIGHVLHPDAADVHGRVGGAWVRRLLGDRVATLIELHVPAKRYLVTVQPGYSAALSSDSTRTLAEQGGPLSPDEMILFTAHPDHHDAIALRRADEAAKVAGLDAGTLAEWESALRTLAYARL